MFARTLTYFYFLFALTILAAAMPGGSPPASTTTRTITVTQTASAPEPTSSCTSGPIQCCQSIQSPTDPAASAILGLLDLVIEGLDVLVGLSCSPISVIGVGSGNACSANVVCCQNNNVGGLISIGCIPIIL
ncbi:fungal hydrophobin [Ganoderma leucocontextum]|nr:fungal hydrophobin [Ganoderma leucocontextum]